MIRWEINDRSTAKDGLTLRANGEGNRYAVYDINTGERLAQSRDSIGMTAFEDIDSVDATARDIVRRIPQSVKDGQQLFLRFGRIPANGKSTNHATGKPERGLSVYHAEYDPLSGGYRFSESFPPHDFGAALTGRFRSCMLLLTGVLLGQGSDGEPVIKHAKIVAPLTYDQARGAFFAEDER